MRFARGGRGVAIARHGMAWQGNIWDGRRGDLRLHEWVAGWMKTSNVHDRVGFTAGLEPDQIRQTTESHTLTTLLSTTGTGADQ